MRSESNVTAVAGESAPVASGEDDAGAGERSPRATQALAGRSEVRRGGSDRLRVAVCQLAATLDVAENRDLVAAAVSRAAASGPDLVVLPEAMMHDFGRADLDLGAIAEALDGPFVQALAAAAAAANAVVVAGLFEARAEGGRPAHPYNTVVAVGPDGSLLARYRKLHLYDAFSYRESDRLTPGTDDPPVFPLCSFMIGLMTCYDLRFPEAGRVLVDQGADVLVVPAAWTAGERKVQHWQALLTARAVENVSYVVGAAQSGPRYTGHSTVLDPMGDVLAVAGSGPDYLVADLDPVRLQEVRAVNPSLANRRFAVTRR